MKGADQCPKCASRATVDIEHPSPKGFYADTIRVCKNCKTLWEPADPSLMLDADDRLSSFLEPCNNCAFRPGSPEQADTEEWKKTIASLKAGGQFFCHKGVPIDIHNANGFAYPDDGKTPRKMRLCRGYLNMWGANIAKAMAEEEQPA